MKLNCGACRDRLSSATKFLLNPNSLVWTRRRSLTVAAKSDWDLRKSATESTTRLRPSVQIKKKSRTRTSTIRGGGLRRGAGRVREQYEASISELRLYCDGKAGTLADGELRENWDQEPDE